MPAHDRILRFTDDDGTEQLSEQQREMLARVDRAASHRWATSREQRDAFVRVIAPLIRELHESGLSARRIADHSVIRPRGVDEALRDGGCRP